MIKEIIAFVLGMIAGAYVLARILYKPLQNVKKQLDDYHDMLDKEVASHLEEIDRLLKGDETAKESRIV